MQIQVFELGFKDYGISLIKEKKDSSENPAP